AMIRLHDQAIIVSLPAVSANHVEGYPLEVLAHEIGHHVLAPATLTDHARMIARMRWALPTVEQHASMIANLYSDLLINDRLQRSAGLRMSDIYQAIGAPAGLVEEEAGEHEGAVYPAQDPTLADLPDDEDLEGNKTTGSIPAET